MSDSYKRKVDGELIREQYFRSERRNSSSAKFKRKHKHDIDLETLPIQSKSDNWKKRYN